MKTDYKRILRMHTKEFLVALVMGASCAYSYYIWPPATIGLIVATLLKTNMELRRLADSLDVPLLPQKKLACVPKSSVQNADTRNCSDPGDIQNGNV